MSSLDVPGMRVSSPAVPAPPRLFPTTSSGTTRANAEALEEVLALHAQLKEMDSLDLRARLNMPLGERNRRAEELLAALDVFVETLP
ncbi:MAG TPA: hypothetical protein VNA30_03285 [Mycobacteriales bacterium]|nr:hypothetical protein [Mycobacteriales bacterium]